MKLREALEGISQFGIVHGDLRPEHAYIHEEGAMFIDWDLAELNNEAAIDVNMIDLRHMMKMTGWEQIYV
jgi:tRNA A-37 threonylcarbamoyl transferase component Bud32